MLTPKDERYQGVEKHSSGFKLLASMGWKEGEGLGPKRQGMKQHIKVRKNVENAGIGLAEARRRAGDWTVGMAAYDQVLAKLGSVSSPTLEDAAGLESQKRGKRKASTSVDQIDSNVSVAAPPVKTSNKKPKTTGASTEHMARKSKNQKTSAAEAEAQLHRGMSNSAAAAALPTTIEKTVAAKASHLARFGRRRAGKSVRSYSGSDLAAILGEKDSAAAIPAELTQPPPATALSWLVADPAETAHPLQGAQQAQPDDEAKWWYRTFARSGRLGSSATKPSPAPSTKHKVKITGFSEDDQTNLYNMAHEACGKGRQGLGIASRSKKVAGARWQGTKKRLDDSSDNDEKTVADAAAELAEQAQQEDSEGSEDTHVSSQAQPNLQSFGDQHSVKEQSQEQKQNSQIKGPVGEHVASDTARELVRSARRVLKAAPGGELRRKKLEKRVLDLLGVQRGSSARKHMRKALFAAVKASTKLKVSDGLVSLQGV